MSDPQRRLTTKPKTFYERFQEKHGSWYDRIKAAEKLITDKHVITAFSLKGATLDQVDAIKTYAEKKGKKDLRGFWNFLAWSEQTYYDILKIQSPE